METSPEASKESINVEIESENAEAIESAGLAISGRANSIRTNGNERLARNMHTLGRQMVEAAREFKDRDDFEEISGVGPTKAEALEEAGYGSFVEIKDATHQELSEVSKIGNALAARIKADIDSQNVMTLSEKELSEVEQEETDQKNFEDTLYDLKK